MTITDQRLAMQTAIVALLNTVSNVGNVVAYKIRAVDETTFQSIMVYTISGTKYIRAWEVLWTGVQDVRAGDEGVPLGHVLRRHTFTINGMVGYDEADSDATFNELVTSVMDKLTQTYRLSGVSGGHRTLAPTVTMDVVPRGDALVHLAEITYTVEELKAVS